MRNDINQKALHFCSAQIVGGATAKMNQRKRLLLALEIMLLGIIMMVTLPGFGFLMLSRIVLRVGNDFFVARTIPAMEDDAPVPLGK